MLFWRNLFDARFASPAIRVALLVGTLLFLINHGYALLTRQMTIERWFSAALTYCIPYFVNIHGQSVSLSRQRARDE